MPPWASKSPPVAARAEAQLTPVEESKVVARSLRGAGSSPALMSTFLRSWRMSPASFHMMPESSSPIATSGRPTVTLKPVCSGVPAAMQEPVPDGMVGMRVDEAHARHAAQLVLLGVVLFDLSRSPGTFSFLGSAGVAANFQPRPPRFVGTCPGASAQLAGSPGDPSPT